MEAQIFRDSPAHPRIAVVGSINIDYSIHLSHFPFPGETILGNGPIIRLGGKGANQAVMAARLGANCFMVGALGDDDSFALSELLKSHVNVDYIQKVSGPTGSAYVFLDAQGENNIVVCQGANSRLSPDFIVQALEEIKPDIVLIQQEISHECVIAATRTGKKAGAKVIVNPAPARNHTREILDDIDVLIPNENELAVLIASNTAFEEKKSPIDTLSPREFLQLASPIPSSIDLIVTLGSEGSIVRTSHGITHIPPRKVHAVDTVGAGDTYCAAFATALGEGKTVEQSCEFATCASAIAVTREGAQGAFVAQEDFELLSQMSKENNA